MTEVVTIEVTTAKGAGGQVAEILRRFLESLPDPPAILNIQVEE